ncbi:LamG-like jellyroll fold domain-containing protein [Deinococcus indicus]|uniref:LamG-like jellyroll fold domain-containing protein n=1 Tax=Deinococcus indicus TaxID=223556 RepID=UPI00174D3524|nr:LamG-like jellyroll fold domain-containing protein [Deinococcus indicus]
MANSVMKLSGVTFSGTLPKLEKDIIIPAQGAVLLYDFGNTATWAGGNPANGAAVGNLVRGVPGASVLASGLTHVGGGFDWAASASAGNSKAPTVNLGNVALGGKTKLLFIAWLRVPNPLPNTFFAGAFGAAVQTAAHADNQFVLDVNNDGGGIRWTTWDQNGNSAAAALASSALTAGGVYQTAWLFDATSGAWRLYLNGAVNTSGTLAAGATSLHATTKPIGLGSWNGDPGAQAYYKGRIYRAYIEDLAASGRDPLSVVQADWAANNGRFS